MTDWSPELALLDKYMAEQESSRAEYARAAARVESSSKVVDGLRAVIPPDVLRQHGVRVDADDIASMAEDTAPTNSEHSGPRGKEAIRRILLDAPGRSYTPAELATELERRGWASADTQHPASAARAAANRLRSEPGYSLENGGFLYREPNPLFPDTEGT